MLRFRLHFCKTGDARFLSHLDLSRCFSRAIRRSGLDVWYTEGFHAHIYLLFSQPLSLGFESLCESVEFKVNAYDFSCNLEEIINPLLPRGIEVYNAVFPKHALKEIESARYLVEIDGASNDLEALTEVFRDFSSTDPLMISKKTKKREQMVDIRPQISSIHTTTTSNRLLLDLLIDAGNSSFLNPRTLLTLAGERVGKELTDLRVLKTMMLTATGEIFC